MNALKTSLHDLSDQDLIENLKILISDEREILTAILHHLKEVESRHLYLAKGFSSLFAYLTEGLGYSESAAYRRIQAMRLMKSIPEIEEKLETGALSLSVASQLQTYLHQEDKKRKVEKKAPVTQSEKQTLIQTLQGTSARECEQKLAKLSPETSLPKEKTRPITDERVLIQFTAGKDLLEKINKLKNLWSHQNPEGSLEKLIEKLADMALEKTDPERKPEKKSTQLPTSEVKGSSTRYIPKTLKTKIWQRDQGKCQYRDPKTRIFCGSKYQIQLDHRYPFVLGGENTEENLRLLCRRHNQYRQDLLIQI